MRKKAVILKYVITICVLAVFSSINFTKLSHFSDFIQRALADVASGDGKAVYGEGTVTTLRARDWATSFSAEGDAANAAATIRHVIIKASPTRDEMIVGVQTTGGVLYIERWNGSSWSNEWNVTVGDGNLPRFDIAYERSTGDVMVAYSANVGTTNEIKYNIWNGSSWGGATNYDAVRTSGVVHAIALATVGGSSNDFAMAWGDANLDLSANYWDGTNNVWKTEHTSALSTGLDTLAAAASLTNWSFDLDFEASGELLIAWGNAATADVSYITRGAGAAGAWGTVSTASAFAEQSDDLELSADPNSDNIILVHTGSDSGNDMEVGMWNGTAFPGSIDTAIPCAANVICAVDATVDTTGAGTSGNSAGWLTSGGATRGIVTYDDTNAAGVDWVVWDSTNGWALQTDCTTNCSSKPASGDDKLHRLRQNPLNDAELMGIFVDSGSDLWAKKLTFDGSNLTWSASDGGTALEATLSSITGLSADFAFNRYIPTPTFTQSAFRFFSDSDSTDVGSALAAQDATSTLAATGDSFRLRILMHVGANQLSASGQTFKLQFVDKGLGTCAAPSGGTPASYTDVTGATVMAYKDNATPADGDTLTANGNDPTHSADAVVNQTYEEANNFTNSVAVIPSGQDGKWDFSLYDNGATANTTYCFKIVKSDGSDIDTYSVRPALVTADVVNQSISFTISTTTMYFGTLTPAGPRYASSTNVGGSSSEVEAHTLAVNTNATNGYTVVVRGQTLTSEQNSTHTINAIGGTNTASSPGTEQFGIRLTATGGTGAVDSPYTASGFAYNATATTSSQIASAVSGDSATTTYSLRYMSNVTLTTEAGSYSTNVVYVVVANF